MCPFLCCSISVVTWQASRHLQYSGGQLLNVQCGRFPRVPHQMSIVLEEPSGRVNIWSVGESAGGKAAAFATWASACRLVRATSATGPDNTITGSHFSQHCFCPSPSWLPISLRPVIIQSMAYWLGSVLLLVRWFYAIHHMASIIWDICVSVSFHRWWLLGYAVLLAALWFHLHYKSV